MFEVRNNFRVADIAVQCDGLDAIHRGTFRFSMFGDPRCITLKPREFLV